MTFTQTSISGVYTVIPDVHADERGFFTRIFCDDQIRKVFPFTAKQINRSFTKKKGTIRGMHFQTEPYAEAKIVQCISGTMYSVALDLRRDSQTFAQWHAQELTSAHAIMLLIPRGCAYGFQSLSDNCEALYIMSVMYSPPHAQGVRFDDPSFQIKWPLSPRLLSERDLNWPLINAL